MMIWERGQSAPQTYTINVSTLAARELLGSDTPAVNVLGGTAVVTLEPCNHHGKTPPCVDALIEAGIATVVYAVADPNPTAAGGAARLTAAGVQVVSDVHSELVVTGPLYVTERFEPVDGLARGLLGDAQPASGLGGGSPVQADGLQREAVGGTQVRMPPAG